MSRTRRSFGADFRIKLILNVLRGEYTESEISQRFQLHPGQVSQWRRQVLKRAAQAMTVDPDAGGERERKRNAMLRTIHQLFAERYPDGWPARRRGRKPKAAPPPTDDEAQTSTPPVKKASAKKAASKKASAKKTSKKKAASKKTSAKKAASKKAPAKKTSKKKATSKKTSRKKS